MENLKLFFRLYFSPAQAMGGIIDRGSWFFAAMIVLLVSILFSAGVNAKLDAAYRVRDFGEFYQQGDDEGVSPESTARRERAHADFRGAETARPKIPLIGDLFFRFFSFDPTNFYIPVLSISLFYVPAVVLLLSFLAGIGSFGVILRRDYAPLATCTLMAWAAGHLPFGLAGLLLGSMELLPAVYLGLWAAGGLLFGLFMFAALRTVFGTDNLPNIITISTAWVGMSLGNVALNYLLPWLSSPFMLLWIVILFGAFIRSEVGGFGNAFRRRQDFKRFLHNATINPLDADARVQLGLIYKQRRQDARALEYFQQAYEIDPEEIDANYELGRVARARGELQQALDHFAVVVEQNDKHSVSEIWREIGATYLEAGMPAEARDALEKFVDRRSFDPEGLYYLGKAFAALGEDEKAREKFGEAIDAGLAPSHQRRDASHWRKLAQKEL
jgi:tetratricopeptide (TPR) repeat protein